MELKSYGITDEMKENAKAEGLWAAKVTGVDKGIYRLVGEKGEFFGEISGKYRYSTRQNIDFPTVGDYAFVDRCTNEDGRGIIHRIVPRRSQFIRKAAGTGGGEQIVGANVDVLFICMSLNNDYNLKRLQRYLCIGWDSNASMVIVLTKADLCKDIDSKILETKKIAIGLEVITTNVFSDGAKKLLPFLKPEKTVAFIGSSGVGKSTLINSLFGNNEIKTNDIRNDDKGRHTTTARQLLLLDNGAMVIDTPGMREMGMGTSENGIGKTFRDVEEIISHCRFKNCSHSNEPGCAVNEAIDLGELSRDRLESYMKLKKEADFAGDSKKYLEEKKQKFKEISKTNKRSKKNELY